MLSSSLYTLLKLSETTSPNELFDYDCVTLYTELTKMKIIVKKQANLPTSGHQKVFFKSIFCVKNQFVKHLTNTRPYLASLKPFWLLSKQIDTSFRRWTT